MSLDQGLTTSDVIAGSQRFKASGVTEWAVNRSAVYLLYSNLMFYFNLQLIKTTFLLYLDLDFFIVH